MPVEAEAYIHRIGRTGRAGATGIALSFCDREERGLLREIERHLGKQIQVQPPVALPKQEPVAAADRERPYSEERTYSSSAPHRGAHPAPRPPTHRAAPAHAAPAHASNGHHSNGDAHAGGHRPHKPPQRRFGPKKTHGGGWNKRSRPAR
jgi:ATP-dependent RNA helicase RhlE